jgi:Fe-S-cluster-containing hydrogenase component 2
MSPAKFPKRKFVNVDPSKCTGCGICEYTCIQEKGESSPLLSRIRLVRMKPLFNFALACRACVDAKCVKACPEQALSQEEATGILMIDKKKCKGCDWCVVACEHGGISIHPDTGFSVACDLCGGEPQCVEFCPEEALETLTADEEADKRMGETLRKLPTEIERITNIVKNKDWKPILAEGEERSKKVSEKLEALKDKAETRKRPSS